MQPTANDELTADNLKQALWETLKQVQSGTMQAHQADAVAAQAREITRTVRLQLEIARTTKRNVTTSVINFSEK